MTSVWSIHFGAQESLECKPVTFGCSGVSGPGKWPIPGSWAWELQFPPGQQIPNPECTKEPVLRSYCVNTVMLNVKEMPSSNLDWEWGDATACKQLGALSVGPDSVLGTKLTLQTISLKYPRTLTLPLCPFPLSFSEEDNPQALSVLKSLEVFCSWAGLKLHMEQSPGRISVCQDHHHQPRGADDR